MRRVDWFAMLVIAVALAIAALYIYSVFGWNREGLI